MEGSQGLTLRGVLQMNTTLVWPTLKAVRRVVLGLSVAAGLAAGSPRGSGARRRWRWRWWPHGGGGSSAEAVAKWAEGVSGEADSAGAVAVLWAVDASIAATAATGATGLLPRPAGFRVRPGLRSWLRWLWLSGLWLWLRCTAIRAMAMGTA